MKPGYYNEFRHRTLDLRKGLGKTISALLIYAGIFTLTVIVYDVGFYQEDQEELYLEAFYFALKRFLLIAFVLRNILNIFNRDKSTNVKLLDFLLLTLIFLVLQVINSEDHPIKIAAWIPSYKYLSGPLYVIVFVIEFSRNAVGYYRRSINPALIFVMSFFVIIALGTGMLSLPTATTEKISLVDALFTAVSAVCITGLIVQDTATFFTPLGQFFIMLLVQIGGLGIITFAGFIGHMFSSGASFQQRMIMGAFSNSEQIGQAIKTITQIIVITLFVEAVGAALIYISTDASLFESKGEHLFFSIFHSVSAFCNAGFSTLTDGLYDIGLRYNYLMLTVIALLFVFSGFGFPIVLNVYYFIKHLIRDAYLAILRRQRFKHVPYALNFNSRIIFISSLSLIVVGWIGFFFFEYNGVLAEHSFTGKIVTSFFGSVTPRTAGFNSVDMSAMAFPTVMLYIMLMWIGASPGGTGGGIKTTTFSVALLNFIAIARGKNRIILFNREIPATSINRAFAIISLSLIVLGLSSTLIYHFDGHLELSDIVFECFSAFSTVGLSLGITGDLSDKSKLVIIVIMFVGRVGVLTFLSAFIFRKKYRGVRYPEESIIY
jgi:Trk-type K+ transport system membrane component